MSCATMYFGKQHLRLNECSCLLVCRPELKCEEKGIYLRILKYYFKNDKNDTKKRGRKPKNNIIVKEICI